MKNVSTADGIAEVRSLADVDERTSNPSLMPGVVSGGRGVGEGKGKQERTTDSGGI